MYRRMKSEKEVGGRRGDYWPHMHRILLLRRKRELMTDAQDSPLSGHFLRRCEQCFVGKKCFHFWTENIECVRRILSFCLLRESERIVPIPAFTFLLDFTVVDPIFSAICKKFYQNKTIMSNIVSPLICAVSVLFCSVSWVGGSTLFAQTETFYLSLFHLSQGYLIWGGGQGTM